MGASGSSANILWRIVRYGALAAVGVVATGCVRRCASRSILSDARRDGVIEVRPTTATGSAAVYVILAGEIGSSTRVRCAYVFGVASPALSVNTWDTRCGVICREVSVPALASSPVARSDMPSTEVVALGTS